MRKKIFGRKLKRDANERKALFKGLLNALVLEESITTTEAKAKSIKGQAEKLVTKAKVKGKDSVPFLMPSLSTDAVSKMITDISGRFSERAGGYTRIIKLGKRFADNAPMVILEWVEKKEKTQPKEEKSSVKNDKTVKQDKKEVTVKVEEKAKKEKKETKKSKKETK